MEIAVIGGTGVYDPGVLQDVHAVAVSTPYGDVQVQVGTFQGREVAFLARHGAGHAVPPHRVNYRANIYALYQLGVKSIFATAAVGSLQPEWKPGDFCLLDDFIDMTHRRDSTFFEGGDAGVVHVDYTEPYCGELRQYLLDAAREVGLFVHPTGTYVCTEGPRYETPAEVRLFASWGAHVVGMTQVPEVVLAREAQMCYAGIAMITNFAAGISPTKLTHAEVLAVMEENATKLQRLLFAAIGRVPPGRHCARGCHEAARELGSLGRPS
ncbi:MAG: S-methyl-5'-thioadenosine phosphorylase [Firmicutes bacterium]|nr:S-methyl-5'-thioadenosine phosphorylase [Bacillota bacterium]